MKNRVKFLMLGVMLITLVSGCGMKTNIQLEISSDKNVDFQVVMALDDEMIDTILSMNSEDGSSSSVTDEQRWAYLKESIAESYDDAKIKKYEEGKFKGYTISISGGSIDEVTGKASEKVNLAGMTEGKSTDDAILFTKNGDNYVSNLTFDVKDNESLSSMSSYSSNMDLYEMNLVIKLPTKAISNNADSTSKDGKTLTWDLTKGSKDIDFEFNFSGASSSSNNNMIYYVAGGVAIVLIIGAVVVLNNKKKVVA